MFGFGARAKMRQRAQALLEPDERVEQIFPASVGHVTSTRQRHRHRIIAVTDRAIVVLEHEGVGYHPVRVLRRVPRATRIGPVSWKGSFCDSLGEELTIDSRWFKDVRAADAAIGWTDD